MNHVTLFCAKYLFALAPLIAGIYWLRSPVKEKKRLALYGMYVAVISIILAKLGSALFYDPRPFMTHNVVPIYPHEPGNGFPSDHTLFTAFIAVTIYSSSKRLGLLIGFVAAVVGVSRVIGHIHNPLDIIGSVLFAVIAGVIAHYVTPMSVEYFNKS